MSLPVRLLSLSAAALLAGCGTAPELLAHIERRR
jgi:hypothetical protein